MDKIINSKLVPFYDSLSAKLFLGDSLELLKKIKPENIDMIFADSAVFSKQQWYYL